MKRGRFSEEQIVRILKEHEAGGKIAEPARKHGVSEATLYGWRVSIAGLGRRNRRLKQLVADLSLDKEALKAIVPTKRWSLPA